VLASEDRLAANGITIWDLSLAHLSHLSSLVTAERCDVCSAAPRRGIARVGTWNARIDSTQRSGVTRSRTELAYRGRETLARGISYCRQGQLQLRVRRPCCET
jgi:hypothetical protein